MSRPEYHVTATDENVGKDAQLPTLAASSPLDAASPSHTVKGTVPQSVRDALADAETLRLNDPDSGRIPSTRSDLELAAWLGATIAANSAAGFVLAYARESARAAFRAVPGLREARQ